MSAGHLIVTLMRVLFPYHMMSRERSENNSTFHTHSPALLPPSLSPLTVPGISHGSLLLSPQQWRSRALASARASSSPVLFMHLEVFVNSSEGWHKESNKGRCVLHNIRGSAGIKVLERLLETLLSKAMK